MLKNRQRMKERSIPAGAGEPRLARPNPNAERVYPRRCGGTSISPPHVVMFPGLSPRVRGNQVYHENGGRCSGSIPAGAGEPGGCFRAVVTEQVYPRGCGGTTMKGQTTSTSGGLSPRVRGNRKQRATSPRSERSIPAGAGEPFAVAFGFISQQVYPRGCGGTHPLLDGGFQGQGLSPRVRGNQPDRLRP